MSYFKDLEEYSDEELMKELRRREFSIKQGTCPYCNRKGSEPACKEIQQHETAKNYVFQNKE